MDAYDYCFICKKMLRKLPEFLGGTCTCPKYEGCLKAERDHGRTQTYLSHVYCLWGQTAQDRQKRGLEGMDSQWWFVLLIACLHER